MRKLKMNISLIFCIAILISVVSIIHMIKETTTTLPPTTTTTSYAMKMTSDKKEEKNNGTTIIKEEEGEEETATRTATRTREIIKNNKLNTTTNIVNLINRTANGSTGESSISKLHNINNNNNNNNKTLARLVVADNMNIHNNINNTMTSSWLESPLEVPDSTTRSASLSPPWVIFYNIYIPPLSSSTSTNNATTRTTTTTTTTSNPHYAMSTIRDQFKQISNSYAATSIPNSTLTIYFNTIGRPIMNEYKFRQEIYTKICHNRNTNRNIQQKHSTTQTSFKLNCIHMNHYTTGYEEVTLENMQEYCKKYSNHSIIYIHNKGSYHTGSKNTYWRRHMTYAVTDHACIQSTTSPLVLEQLQHHQQQQPPPPNHLVWNTTLRDIYASSNCNICGLLATALPWISFAGNFFTAQCSYINKLLPPTYYGQELQKLAIQTRQMTTSSEAAVPSSSSDNTSSSSSKFSFVFRTFPNNDAYLGLGRFANEHWPTSHPSVRICDVSRTRQIEQWKRLHKQPLQEFDWDMFPRRKETFLQPQPNTGKTTITNNKQKEHFNSLRIREYYLLAGNMFKWIHLYNTIPDQDSFVWTYFPDGPLWRETYLQYGNQTFDVVFQKIKQQQEQEQQR